MKQFKELPAAIILAKAARDAIYAKIDKDPKYGAVNGTIRVMMTPLCKKADDWLGELNDWEQIAGEKGDVIAPANMSWEFSIKLGQSRVRQLTDGDALDTEAYSAMQAAYELLKQSSNHDREHVAELQKNFHFWEIHGWAKREGAFAVCVINFDQPANQQGFMNLCISVISDTASKDHELSQIGVDAIMDVLHECGRFATVF